LAALSRQRGEVESVEPQRMTSMMVKTKTPRKTLSTGIGKVQKRLHYPLDVIQLRVPAGMWRTR
jgi:hypothetical protein